MVMAAMMTNDRALVDEVSRMDNSVDNLDEAIKLYVTKLPRGSLDEREGKRAMEIVSFAINLEHTGDIIDKNLSELATKKIKRRFQFSPEGAEELSAFHKRTADRLRPVHVGRRQRSAKTARREGQPAQRRAGRHRTPPRPPARGPPREHRNHVAAPRRAARPPPHPLAYLLGRLPRTRRRRRTARAPGGGERAGGAAGGGAAVIAVGGCTGTAILRDPTYLQTFCSCFSVSLFEQY